MSNKRRRNEIGIIDDKDLIDKLDRYPYLLRSIQASEYIIMNPLFKIKIKIILKEFKNILFMLLKYSFLIVDYTIIIKALF